MQGQYNILPLGVAPSAPALLGGPRACAAARPPLSVVPPRGSDSCLGAGGVWTAARRYEVLAQGWTVLCPAASQKFDMVWLALASAPGQPRLCPSEAHSMHRAPGLHATRRLPRQMVNWGEAARASGTPSVTGPRIRAGSGSFKAQGLAITEQQ